MGRLRCRCDCTTAANKRCQRRVLVRRCDPCGLDNIAGERLQCLSHLHRLGIESEYDRYVREKYILRASKIAEYLGLTKEYIPGCRLRRECSTDDLHTTQMWDCKCRCDCWWSNSSIERRDCDDLLRESTVNDQLSPDKDCRNRVPQSVDLDRGSPSGCNSGRRRRIEIWLDEFKAHFEHDGPDRSETGANLRHTGTVLHGGRGSGYNFLRDRHFVLPVSRACAQRKCLSRRKDYTPNGTVCRLRRMTRRSPCRCRRRRSSCT